MLSLGRSSIASSFEVTFTYVPSFEAMLMLTFIDIKVNPLQDNSTLMMLSMMVKIRLNVMRYLTKWDG